MRNRPRYRIGQKVYYIKQTSKTLNEAIKIEQQEIKSSIVYGIRQDAPVIFDNIINLRTGYCLSPVIDVWTPEEDIYPTLRAAKKALLKQNNKEQYTKLTIL